MWPPTTLSDGEEGVTMEVGSGEGLGEREATSALCVEGRVDMHNNLFKVHK
jgi:hypothetical protein